MPWKTSCRATVLAAALIAGPASAETLRTGGVGTAGALLPPLFAAFDPAGEHQLQWISALGSSGGLRAAVDGLLDLVVSGRTLEPAELAQGLTLTLVIRTPFVFVTSRPKPDTFRKAKIADIYQSTRATWPDGTPVRIVMRPASDSDTPVLQTLFPGMTSALELARKRGELPVAPTDQANTEMAEQTPGSLATSTFTQIQLERRKLHFIPIDGVEPSLESLEGGTYPFAKVNYFVLPAKKSSLAERFIAFLGTPDGQAALRATGNLPAAD